MLAWQHCKSSAEVVSNAFWLSHTVLCLQNVFNGSVLTLKANVCKSKHSQNSRFVSYQSAGPRIAHGFFELWGVGVPFLQNCWYLTWAVWRGKEDGGNQMADKPPMRPVSGGTLRFFHGDIPPPAEIVAVVLPRWEKGCETPTSWWWGSGTRVSGWQQKFPGSNNKIEQTGKRDTLCKSERCWVKGGGGGTQTVFSCAMR